MDEYVINIGPILLVILLGVIAFLIHNGCNINVFVKKDEHIAEKFLDKFPLVTPEFMQKNTKEQNIENNQEIHEINKRIDEIEANQQMILDLLDKLQNKD